MQVGYSVMKITITITIGSLIPTTNSIIATDIVDNTELPNGYLKNNSFSHSTNCLFFK